LTFFEKNYKRNKFFGLLSLFAN